MSAFLRPYLTAGVALVGASVVAVAPVAAPPPLPDIQVAATSSVSAPLHLTAVSDPIAAITQLFTNTSGSLGALFDQVADNPTPILSQLITNQLANGTHVLESLQEAGEALQNVILPAIPVALESIFDQLSAGDLTGAVSTLQELAILVAFPAIGAIGPVLAITDNTVANLSSVVGVLTDPLGTVLGLGLGALRPVFAVTNSIADNAEAIFTAVSTGDFETAVGVALSSPFTITDALLNGFGPAPLGQATGLLSTPGLVNALLSLRESIANAMTPVTAASARAAASTAVDEDAPTVDLTVGAAEAMSMRNADKQAAGAVEVDAKTEETAPETTVTAGSIETVEMATGVTEANAVEVAESVEAEPELAETAERASLTRNSLKAVPGQSATRMSASETANNLRTGINTAVDNLRSGIERTVDRVIGDNPSNNTSSGVGDSSASSSSADSGGSDE